MLRVVCSGFLALAFLAGAGASSVAQGLKPNAYPSMAPLDQYLMPRDAEIALARTAAPPSISADAEVLVLGRKGYESAVQGHNGFVCFVERSWTAGFEDPQFWNAKLRAPNCFNPPAARSVLPQYLERTRWILAGATREQAIARARAEFAAGRFTAPEPGALTFMLSKDGFVSDAAAGPWLPHIMFFVPRGTAASWAAGLDGSPVIGGDGTPEDVTLVLVPVQKWSDGTAPALPAEHTHQN